MRLVDRHWRSSAHGMNSAFGVTSRDAGDGSDDRDNGMPIRGPWFGVELAR